MRGAEKDRLTVGGARYGAATARLFGVAGNPVLSRRLHLAVGRAVWGERPEWCRPAPGASAGTYRAEIGRRFDPARWAALRRRERRRLCLAGLPYGPVAARAFGFRGDPVPSPAVHRAIGRCVWGECPELQPLTPATARQRLATEIGQRFVPESWAALPGKVRRRLRLAGLRYGQRVAALLGVAGRPTDRLATHLAVGRAVWGDLPCLRVAATVPLDADRIRADIRRTYTPVTWARLPLRARTGLVLGGRGYGQAVASALGVKGDPCHLRRAHLEVGRAVWGSHPALAVPTPQELRLLVIQAIRARFSPAAWIGLTVRDRRALTLGPLRYRRAVGRLFGTPSNPMDHYPSHRAVGLAVWGAIAELECETAPERQGR